MSLLPKSPRQRRRLLLVASLVGAASVATAFILLAFERNLMYFYTPSDILSGRIAARGVIELGGMVKPGSLRHHGEGLRVEFAVSDGRDELIVHYEGVLPDLFREGQGVVAYGRLVDGGFHANRILAKHDESYMPAHLHERLKRGEGADAAHGYP